MKHARPMYKHLPNSVNAPVATRSTPAMRATSSCADSPNEAKPRGTGIPAHDHTHLASLLTILSRQRHISFKSTTHQLHANSVSVQFKPQNALHQLHIVEDHITLQHNRTQHDTLPLSENSPTSAPPRVSITPTSGCSPEGGRVNKPRCKAFCHFWSR